eukprot:scaffold59293_cov51-Prasinocladus_malaysianus.AAC.1
MRSGLSCCFHVLAGSSVMVIRPTRSVMDILTGTVDRARQNMRATSHTCRAANQYFASFG